MHFVLFYILHHSLRGCNALHSKYLKAYCPFSAAISQIEMYTIWQHTFVTTICWWDTFNSCLGLHCNKSENSYINPLKCNVGGHYKHCIAGNREKKWENISISGFVLHIEDSSAEQDRRKKFLEKIAGSSVFFKDRGVSSKSFQSKFLLWPEL